MFFAVVPRKPPNFEGIWRTHPQLLNSQNKIILGWLNHLTSKKPKCTLSFNWYSVNQIERKGHFDQNASIAIAFKSMEKHNVSTWKNIEVMEEWIHCTVFIFLSAKEVQNIIKKYSLVYFLVKSFYSFNASYYIYVGASLIWITLCMVPDT